MSQNSPDARMGATHGNGLPDSVRKLGWISFFTDFASEMVYPVVPLFLSTALGAPAAVLGLIEGVAEAVVSLMKGASGWHSDRTGKRVPLIRLGYGLGALSKPLMALAFAWPVVFLARSLDRLGKGLRTTARDALVAEAIDVRMAGRAYGFHRAMDTSGAIVGALAALGLLWLLPGNYRTIFLLAALPGAWAVWLTFRLREPSPKPGPKPVPMPVPMPGPKPTGAPQPGKADLEPSVGHSIDHSIDPSVEHSVGHSVDPSVGPSALARPGLRQTVRSLPAAYWRTIIPLALFALANSSDAFLLLRAKGLGLDDMQVVLAYILFNVVYAASAYPLGILSDRLGRWPLLCCGWVIYAGVYLGMGSLTASSIWWLLPLYGLYMGLTEGVGKAVVAVQTQPGTRGVAIGLFQMSVGLMTLTGSILAGVLWDAFGAASAFHFGAGAALAALVAVALLAPWRRAAA